MTPSQRRAARSGYRYGPGTGRMNTDPMGVAVDVARFVNPGADLIDASEYSGATWDAFTRGDYLNALANLGLTAASVGMVAIPGTVSGVKKGTDGLLDVISKGGKKKAKKKKTQKDIPDLRGLPVDEAVKIARKEPHLIPSHEAAEGKYVGGPRNIKTKQQLNKMRRELDAYIAKSPDGMDWYDRYRDDMDLVTGGDPVSNKWMSAQEGQWSAGQSPEIEFGMAIKENNGTLTGFPVKAGRPLLHERHNEAARMNDVTRYVRGDKTGEYADHIIPGSVLANTATGVNDFRHARNLGYTEPDGSPQGGTLGKTQHIFSDYETALAVDRANKARVGGRSDWTGERLQAAPWVAQKAEDLYRRGENAYKSRAKKSLLRAGVKDPSEMQIESLAKESAFNDANKQIGDFFPKHTAHATYESMPGPNTGHLTGLIGAPNSVRENIGADPRSSFSTAPNGRDAIYSGLRYGDTGVAGRVLPTVQSQGVYQPPGGDLELNPGRVARPLVGLHNTGSNKKVLPEGDRAMLEAGEALRSAIAAQDAGAAHITTVGGTVGDQRSVRAGMDRKLSPEELLKVQGVAEKYGLGDVVDTGTGITATRFDGSLNELPGGLLSSFAKDLHKALPDSGAARRVNVDGIYVDLVDAWKAGEGSGRVSKEILDRINVTPELRSAFDNNPYIAQVALDHIARDEALAKAHGTTVRKDLQKLREIIGSGPGWVGRVEEAVKKGIVPAAATALLTSAYSLQGQEKETSLQ